ncbi:MAG TPA: hypothetical protein VLD63_12045 [Anaerolineales bacterium]|nr:hypothetical protein [Anaerolineales bacterium]
MSIRRHEDSQRLRWVRGTRNLVLTALPLLLPAGAAAQAATSQAPAGQPAAGAPSASELAKQTQNPIASLISFPLQGNWDMGVGDREATSTLVNVQPVIPFAISKSTNVVLRVITPLTSRPSSGTDGARINGLGDIVFSTFLSPSKSGRVIWGVGPVLLLPTATNGALGAEKFGVGPTAVVLTQPGNWTIGLLANQIWSTSGASDREDVNATYLQPFVNYNLGSGLSVGVSAEATGNWEADDEKWSSPLLFSVSKVTTLGKRPVNFTMAAGPTFGPDAGPDWRFRFAANFLFPR